MRRSFKERGKRLLNKISGDNGGSGSGTSSTSATENTASAVAIAANISNPTFECKNADQKFH